jgi:hypothetical protein
MLISPRSNVSVPFTVVIRTLSNVADSDLEPETRYISSLAFDPSPTTPEAAHEKVVEFSSIRVTLPESWSAAKLDLSLKPVLEVSVETVLLSNAATDAYEVVSTPPESPSCISFAEVPFVETPLNETTICFVPAGIPVKSMLVPDVEATGVPRVKPADTVAKVGAEAPLLCSS